MIRVAVEVRRVPRFDVRRLAAPHVGVFHHWPAPRIVVGRHRVRWMPRYPSESLFPSQSVFPIGA